MSDFARWPEWTPTITGIRQIDPGPAATGVRFEICQPKAPPAVWQVTEMRHGWGFDWVSRRPGVEVIARHWIQKTADGSRVTLSLEFNGWLGGAVGWLLSGMNRKYLALEAAGLKQRAEA